jgi:ferredoxin like protein
MNVEDLPQLTQFCADDRTHIVIDQNKCRECDSRECVQACPAGCYAFNEETRLLSVVYESCLECGTCRIICDKGALNWSYPRGGYGVLFRLT